MLKKKIKDLELTSFHVLPTSQLVEFSRDEVINLKIIIIKVQLCVEGIPGLGFYESENKTCSILD